MKNPSNSTSAFFNPRVLVGALLCLVGVALAFFALRSVSAQGKSPETPVIQGTYRGIAPVIKFDVSPALRDMKIIPPDQGKLRENEDREIVPLRIRFAPEWDPVVQTTIGGADKRRPQGAEIPGPIVSFDAQSITASPPDPNGAVGPNHVVTMANVSFQILTKTGTSVFGPAANNTLWSGFGGPCQTENSGDPVVLYDRLADRWFLSQFTSAGPTFFFCVAISQTPDPTGTYHRYAISTGSNFPDYPKASVWPDAYYVSTREFAGASFAGVGAYALNRGQALAGIPTAQVLSFLAPPDATPYNVGDGLLPADMEGMTPPPLGSPNYFVGSMDNNGPYGAPQDALTLWKFTANFTTPASSTFVLANTIPVATFNSILGLCGGTRACIPQPGTANRIDHLGYRQRPLFRLAYRNFGTHESLVTNQSVSGGTGPNGEVSGIRWWELRSPNVTPVIFQEGTYAPGVTDGIHRWMGSAAIDGEGNIALGYSAANSASPALFPSLFYTGRFPTDPAGQMSQGEAIIHTGTGSQTAGGNRWGDYTSLTIDPTDDLTFWHVNEYVPTTSPNSTRLRVGSFNFAQFPPAPKGTAHFAITICSSGAPLTNAVVSIDGSVYGASVTGGLYDAVLAPGTHTYSVSKPTFGTVTGMFTITNGMTTNVPLCLAGAPLLTAGTATLVSESCAPPNGAIDPGETVTVALAVQNTGGADTVNDVGTLQASGGVTGPSGPQNYGVLVAGGAAVSRNFTFTADPMLACGSNITATVAHVDGVSNLGNLTYTLPTGVAGMTPTTTSYTGPAVFVPDNVPAGSNIILPVSGITGGISDLDFRLDSLAGCSNAIGDTNASMDHTFNADLTFKLTSPQGTTVILIAGRGGAGNNFCTVVLDDAAVAATSTMSTAGAIAGTFRPESPLSAFNGQNPNGNWTLNVADTAGIDTGFLRRYSLIITPKICCVGGPPVPQSAVSRKTHNTSPLPMDFDVVLPLVPVSGAVGIEPRMGPAHTMVVSFASAVTTTGAIVTTGTGTVGSVTGSGTGTIVINLTGVSDVQRLGVTLQNVNDGMGHVGDVLIPMGVLLGDTNGSGAPIGVSSSDVVQTKAAASSGVVNGGTFRTDMNASGAVNSSDVLIVKSRSGAVLPP